MEVGYLPLERQAANLLFVLVFGAIKLCTSNDQFWWATRS
jgi:hypothetical protein